MNENSPFDPKDLTLQQLDEIERLKAIGVAFLPYRSCWINPTLKKQANREAMKAGQQPLSEVKAAANGAICLSRVQKSLALLGWTRDPIKGVLLRNPDTSERRDLMQLRRILQGLSIWLQRHSFPWHR